MSKIRDVLRLSFDSRMSNRKIAKSLGISRGVVADYLARFSASGLSWPLPGTLTEPVLQRRFFPPVTLTERASRGEPNWETIHLEMKRKGATLQVLYDEEIKKHAFGLSYTTFCRRYRRFKKQLRRYMRQDHHAGEKVFVDFSGKTLAIVDLESGHTHQAQIFCGVLGASLYTYAEALWKQDLPSWIGVHERMFRYFKGVPEIVVCDNLKAAVTKASRTEPEINPTYLEMAAHYGTMILAARPHEPQDKSRAEQGVLLVQRWILFRLRNRAFVSLSEANDAIRQLLGELNARPFQKLEGSRLSTFETIERPALKPLPRSPYDYCEYCKVYVGADYHFAFENHHYSVPCSLVGRELDIRVTQHMIEVLHQGQRIASHPRSSVLRGVTTNPEHMDPGHRHYSQWNPQRALAWGKEVGEHTHAFIEMLLGKHKAVELSYRSISSLRKLGETYGLDRLESACRVGLTHRADKADRIRSILKSRLDLIDHKQERKQEADFEHANIRGPKYYE